MKVFVFGAKSSVRFQGIISSSSGGGGKVGPLVDEETCLHAKLLTRQHDIFTLAFTAYYLAYGDFWKTSNIF